MHGSQNVKCVDSIEVCHIEQRGWTVWIVFIRLRMVCRIGWGEQDDEHWVSYKAVK